MQGIAKHDFSQLKHRVKGLAQLQIPCVVAECVG